jgi:hypothetical protein
VRARCRVVGCVGRVRGTCACGLEPGCDTRVGTHLCTCLCVRACALSDTGCRMCAACVCIHHSERTMLTDIYLSQVPERAPGDSKEPSADGLAAAGSVMRVYRCASIVDGSVARAVAGVCIAVRNCVCAGLRAFECCVYVCCMCAVQVCMHVFLLYHHSTVRRGTAFLRAPNSVLILRAPSGTCVVSAACREFDGGWALRLLNVF